MSYSNFAVGINFKRLLSRTRAFFWVRRGGEHNLLSISLGCKCLLHGKSKASKVDCYTVFLKAGVTNEWVHSRVAVLGDLKVYQLTLTVRSSKCFSLLECKRCFQNITSSYLVFSHS